jgi:signal transduction histidine kinase
MSELRTLKDQLSKALGETETDINKILSLATEIAKHDSDTVRFSVDASHISRLGIELVSKQETAVAELVKNAYDADAVTVYLTFKDSLTRGGELEIIDDGHGMSRSQLLDGFMRISTQDKFLSPISSKFQRQKAGRKGIGRFATQRLGRQLTIKTQREAEEYSLELNIDWDLFERGKDLHLISSQIEMKPKMKKAGTALVIRNLRDPWTEAQIQRTYRYISELIQPYPLNKKDERSKGIDPGFKATFLRSQNGAVTTVAGEEASIYRNSFAKFTGYVNSKGVPYIDITSERYGINIKEKRLPFDQKTRPRNEQELTSYPLLSGIRYSAHYFIQDELPSGTKTYVQKVLRRQGGVRVYRNGFRVLPYGEPFDDWLGLQQSSAVRELLPPHHNSNFLGFVEINDVAGENFEETASREGLLENEAFHQLQDFIHRSLVTGVIEVAQKRNKKIYSSDKKPTGDFTPSPAPNPKDLANQVAAQLRAAAAQESESEKNQPQALIPGTEQTSNFEELAKQVELLGEKSQNILEENGMLRVLASLGLTIGEFTHEVRHALAALKVGMELLESNALSKEVISDVKDNVLLLQSYVRYFDNAIIQNAHRSLSAHELRDLVREFSEVVRPSLDRQNIQLTYDFNGYDLFTKPMHKSEWSSILLNLFTNSLKAIQRAQAKGKIHIVGGRDDGQLYLKFSDNGDGIPDDNVEKVFDAFFTTSAPPSALSSDSEQLVGTGLGLKIVCDIVTSANGDIYLTQPPEGFSTCFRIDIPEATEEEVGDERY